MRGTEAIGAARKHIPAQCASPYPGPMKPFFALSLFLAAAACGDPTSQSSAHEAPASAQVAVTNAWAAPTPSGVDVSAGYLTITNGTNAEDHLLSATSPRATRVEIHEMTMDGSVMRMRALDRLPVPAGGSAQLAPGGAHLMFFGVNEPFANGQSIPVRLVFEHAGAINVTLPVQRTAPVGHGNHQGN